MSTRRRWATSYARAPSDQDRRHRILRIPNESERPIRVMANTDSDVQRQGLDQFERIGAEVSEVIERRPASAVVVEVIRPKFCRKRATARSIAHRYSRPRVLRLGLSLGIAIEGSRSST